MSRVADGPRCGEGATSFSATQKELLPGFKANCFETDFSKAAAIFTVVRKGFASQLPLRKA
jgi:hypothetical protein